MQRTTVQSAVLDGIDVDRIARLGLELVRIRSYTGDTVEATVRLAEAYRDADLDVQEFRFPEYVKTPGLVARLRGAGAGPSLELNGHIDTIPLDHAPPKIEGSALHGRGATDMKASLACALEAVRAIRDAGVTLRGDVMLSTHGLHEAPGGHGEDLAARLRMGVHGDAAIVMECGSDTLPVECLGLATFEVTISRQGDVTHENSTLSGTPHPIIAAGHLLRYLESQAQDLAAKPLPLAGPPSIFVGEIHGGDFYNRFPTSCRVVGTRRWAPEEHFAYARAELEALCHEVAHETGARVDLGMELTREGFRVDAGEPLVGALRRSYRAVVGRILPDGGLRSVADASLYRQIAGVPALYHGPQGTGHHGDEERIELAELLRATRVFALTILDFCGVV